MKWAHSAVLTLTTLLGMLATSEAHAAIISNGSLVVDISDSNGSINSVILDGTEFFRHGTYVSDFGFQNGTDIGTFVLNTAEGFTGQLVSVTGTTVSGNYVGGGADIQFSRNYSLVSGVNVLRITTQLTNQGIAPTTVSYFDSFDPDQGFPILGYFTFNDVISLAGTVAGEASALSGYTFVAGSLDPRVVVASGGPFAIISGSLLNDFFDFPVDDNGFLDDLGTHLGLRVLLGAGQTTSVTYDLAFGPSSAEARDEYTAAQVPEPGSIAIFAAGSALFGVVNRRRRKTELKAS
ncbi:MAG: PEP-CTERM sorting domain-containing protein [Pirellulaceae bacterium]|jgi:hypothetical protein